MGRPIYGNGHHDHDDRKCRDKKKHDDRKHEENKGLLKEFDVFESGDFPNLVLQPNSRIIGKVETCVDDKGNRVLLNAAVNWEPSGHRTFTGGIGAIVNALLGLLTEGVAVTTALTARFTIWRGNPVNCNGTGLCRAEPICSFTDSTPIDIDVVIGGGALGAALDVNIGFAPVTTDFKCVDEDPDCGENDYFLTMEILPTDGVALPLFASDNFTPKVVFTAMEIEENKKDDCC